jgi:predicted anti-sigma-YlaC factor YlaD
MRTIAAILILTAGISFAWPKAVVLDMATGTNTTASATFAESGYVEAVYVSSSNDTTGTVAVAHTPLGLGTAISIATGIVEAEKTWRPRIDATGVDGSALTGDPPLRFVLAGEPGTVSISDSPTGVVWRAVIIVSEK